MLDIFSELKSLTSQPLPQEEYRVRQIVSPLPKRVISKIRFQHMARLVQGDKMWSAPKRSSLILCFGLGFYPFNLSDGRHIKFNVLNVRLYLFNVSDD
jgi:hypothetical protein